jgi:hypothetical protein
VAVAGSRQIAAPVEPKCPNVSAEQGPADHARLWIAIIPRRVAAYTVSAGNAEECYPRVLAVNNANRKAPSERRAI